MSNGAKHILFVDDEGEVRFTASRYFKKHGYQVSTAENAEEALRVADGMPCPMRSFWMWIWPARMGWNS